MNLINLVNSKHTCASVLESAAASNEEGPYPDSYSFPCLDPWDPHLVSSCASICVVIFNMFESLMKVICSASGLNLERVTKLL